MSIFGTDRRLGVPAALAAVLTACGLGGHPASATNIGTPGPYSYVTLNPVKYAPPVQDTVIECKPQPTAGHFAGPFPAVLLIHGGAWGGGSNAISSSIQNYTGYSSSWCRLWATWGFDAFSVGYRLTGTAPWPAQIIDVQAAVRWVRANAASLNVNPNLIVAEGDSAGGQLSLIAGNTRTIMPGDLASLNPTVSPQVQMVVSQFGPWKWGPNRPAGTPSTRAMDYATQLMLDQAAGLTTAPVANTLFVQGTQDFIVNQCAESEPAYRFLTNNKRPASYIAYKGGHEYTGMVPSAWGSIVGGLQMQTISFAYAGAKAAGALPGSEIGPNLPFSDASMPVGCP